MSDYKEMFTPEEIAEIEKIIGYTFGDKRLLCKAFVHSSFAKENGVASNERLEFFGDRILNFLVSEQLFLNVEGSEGVLKEELECRVSSSPLCALVKKLDLFKFVKRSKNVSFGDKKISDLFEAIIAAVYLDAKGDFTPCRALVKMIEPSKEDNYIGKLKEFCEKNKLGKPEARYFGESPFECVVTVDGQEFSGSGIGKSAAEKDACRKACEKLNIL